MLTSVDFKLLEALCEDGGFTTGIVSERAKFSYGGDKRQRSGAVRLWLLRLEAENLVARLDDQSPVCWVRTKAGTDALRLTRGVVREKC